MVFTTTDRQSLTQSNKPHYTLLPAHARLGSLFQPWSKTRISEPSVICVTSCRGLLLDSDKLPAFRFGFVECTYAEDSIYRVFRFSSLSSSLRQHRERLLVLFRMHLARGQSGEKLSNSSCVICKVRQTKPINAWGVSLRFFAAAEMKFFDSQPLANPTSHVFGFVMCPKTTNAVAAFGHFCTIQQTQFCAMLPLHLTYKANFKNKRVKVTQKPALRVERALRGQGQLHLLRAFTRMWKQPRFPVGFVTSQMVRNNAPLLGLHEPKFATVDIMSLNNTDKELIMAKGIVRRP